MDLCKEFILLIEFTKQESLKSVKSKYWSIFLDTVLLILLILFLNAFCFEDFDSLVSRKGPVSSAVKGAIGLLFTFDRTIYSRQTPLHFDDRLKLEKNKFMEGDFCVQPFNLRIKCSPNGPSTRPIT